MPRIMPNPIRQLMNARSCNSPDNKIAGIPTRRAAKYGGKR